MKKLIAITVAGVLGAGVPAFAKTIKKKEAAEEQRIERGVNRGQITPKEQQRLEDQQKVIDQERANAAADGKVTKRERKDIKHDQKRLSHDIEHKRHNAQGKQQQ
jgi:uncharacterized protein HemX